MQRLARDLEAAKEETKITKLDLIHEENMKQGRDKQKTRKQIRRGSTRQRIDEFEAM